jgi:hypothetical protein
MTDKNFKIYKHKNKIIAVVVKRNFKKTEGMKFFTPENFSEQLAFVSHRKGKIIKPHIHKKVKRHIHFTQEVDILKKGRIKLTLYTDGKKPLKTLILDGGDIVLFASGGHGYEVLEDIEMILVKQGPYAGEKDKTYIKEKKQ